MESLNYRVYQGLSKFRTGVLNVIPIKLIPNKRRLDNRIQIGITTYIDRYEEFFKPLYKAISTYFPEVDLIIAVNGFFNKEEQGKYLDKLQVEICAESRDNCRFILHDKPVGLTKLWNEIIIQSSGKNTLLLNDDLQVYPWFRKWVEKVGPLPTYVTLLNGTWSNFIISDMAIKTIGWFDEGFEGIGFEDMDYTARTCMLKLPISNLKCPYLNHRDHKPNRTSFDQITGKTWGKYSSMNEEYFFKKWQICAESEGVYIKQLRQNVRSTQFDSIRTTNPKGEHQLFFRDKKCFPDRLNEGSQ